MTLFFLAWMVELSHAYRDRPLSTRELEQLRLILSVYKDGTGQVALKPSGRPMPGFRDYERALADVVGGSTPEGKGVFDVVVPAEPQFGISCKMTVTRPAKYASSFMELSNSAKYFRDHLLGLQIHWSTEPTLAGPAIVDVVESWHLRLSNEIDLEHSKYSVLSHDRKWEKFQILCFSLDVKRANPRGDINWVSTGSALHGYVDVEGREHRLWEYYPNSGGQLKYYPPFSWADWMTEEFALEVPPPVSLKARAAEYFPDLWPGD